MFIQKVCVGAVHCCINMLNKPDGLHAYDYENRKRKNVDGRIV